VVGGVLSEAVLRAFRETEQREHLGLGPTRVLSGPTAGTPTPPHPIPPGCGGVGVPAAAMEAFLETQRREAGFGSSTSALPPKKRPRGKPVKAPFLLLGATDWETTFDLPGEPYCLPQELNRTGQRPDGVIWSFSKKCVIFLELTCPMEENMLHARTRKQDRYAHLCLQVENLGWTAHCLTVEVGSRGFVGSSVGHLFRQLNLKSNRGRWKTRLSELALRSSYVIFLCRKNPHWTTYDELK